MSLQFSNPVGVDIAELGCILKSPTTTGYSSQFAQNLTTGQTIDFDGSDQTNMSFFVDTAAAPTPGPATLLLASLPFATRRRR